MFRTAFLSFCALAAAALPLRSEDPPAKPEEPLSAATFTGLKLRAIGPALMSGRVVTIAVHPTHPATWYIGAASGGVWKTNNAGATWTPVFECEGSYSIATVVIDPRNPNTVWVGAGESGNQRSVGYGDGVYRSDDAGRTWRNTGLKQSEHIGRLVIDPRDSNVVYAAALGPLWGPGGDRGLYKTTDGGRSWKQILKIGENTGVTDVALDPHNPDTILASAHQRRRHVWTLIHGGPESALYKSTDAGATFNKVKTGLPESELGRIGLAFSPARRGLVYARVEAAEGGGVFASNDSGESWERRGDFTGLPMYYAQIIPDPNESAVVYMMDTIARVSSDGGRTFRPVGERSKHVDTHVYWIDPKDSAHILAGCDGGLYESWDRGRIWRHFANLSITQFYNVEVDNATPIYNVYGGTQDNNTVGGPSRTRGVDGAQNADWFVVTGGDGFVSRIDPTDPNIVYGESQYGGLVRLDRRTAERVSIQPSEGKGEPPLRFNWESPFLISPHSPARLYFGANILFRSDDRGSNWKAVSGDLTRQLDRNTLPVMGRIWPPEAVAKHQSTSTYGNLTALSESRKLEGLLYTGSDDGLIQVSENGGQSWRKIDNFPGVPDVTYVQRVYASRHDAATVYALFDNHKNADFKPYILKSADRGATWTSVSGDLPANGPALSLAEDPVNPNLLFAGTEFGLYFTIDGGRKWTRLKGNLPVIPVRDLAVQERENDLVLATFGRGFYILDDLTPLRLLRPETFLKDAELFPVRNATAFVPDIGKRRASQGEQLWMADNPPFGATFTYWLKDELKSKKQLRLDAQAAAEKKKEVPPYPTPAQLTAEADEPAPQLLLTVTAPDGKIIRRLSGPVKRGIHRVTWNLRVPGAKIEPKRSEEDETGNSDFDAAGAGFAAPGVYTVSLAQRVNGVLTSLGAPRSFTVAVEHPVQTSLADFQRRITKLQRALAGALEAADEAKSRLAAIEKAIPSSGADAKLLDETQALQRRLTVILRKLRGDETLRGLESGSPSSISSRVSSASESRAMISAPTGTMEKDYRIAGEELAEQLPKLKTLLEVDLKKLERELDAAGVPHTPGRLPDWK